MAFNGQYVSIRQIIEKAYRDSGLENIDFEAAIEWSSELMGLIGVPYFYIERTTNNDDVPAIVVENFRAVVPVGMVSVKSMRRIYLDGDSKVIKYTPMIESQDIYFQTIINKQFHNEVNAQEFSTDEEEELVVEPTTISLDQIRNTASGAYSYKIQNGVIFTNFETGYLEMVYKSHPIDDEGYLLIPDDEAYKQALKYFIIYKLDWKNWRANPASPGLKAVVNDSEQQSLFYIASARGKAHIPSIDKMEAIKNMWVRTIPKMNEHANGFATANVQEMRYNQRTVRRIR